MAKPAKKGLPPKVAILAPRMERVLAAFGKLPVKERRQFINAVSDQGPTNPKLGNPSPASRGAGKRPATSQFGNPSPDQEDYFRQPRNRPGQYKDRPDASINPARVTLSVRMRANLIKGLTFERLVTYLDQWRLGFFRSAGMAWATMEQRDYQLQIVRPKRLKSVARHGYDILIAEQLEDSQKALAQQQKDFLANVYGNATATTAINPDEEGGFSLLVRQMMDAVGKYYSVHEIVWEPDFDGRGNLTAKFIHCPIWWFEGTRGKLRFLPSEFQIYGNEMAEGEWLVTCGEGLMEACSAIYLFKYLPLKSWLSFLDRFGQPGIHGKTDAQKGTPQWNDFVEAVGDFAEEWATVTNRSADISLIEAKATGDAGYEKIIELMDKKITQLWRGGDLGTSAGKDATGASLQQDESEILETDDAKMIEETLTQKVSRFALAWKFGPDTPQLAYLKLRTTPRKNIQDDIAVDTFLAGFRDKAGKGLLGTQATLERYGRPLPKPDDDTLASAVAPVNPAPTIDPKTDSEFANADDVALVLQETLLPILKRLEAIAKVDDAAIQQHMLEKLLKDFPAIAEAITADDSLAKKLAPKLEAALLAGLTKAKPSKS